MSDQKTKRAGVLRRLFEAQKKKTPTELPEEEREKAAGGLMDRMLGPDWRIEIQMPDITIMTPPPVPDQGCEAAEKVSAVNEAAESFYDRVIQAMNAEGLSPEELGWNKGSSTDPKDAAKRIMLAKQELDGKK